ncbi:hypothetical protein LSH36_1120g01062 [Paralvinella palmiformis]|uniref:MI domain-containing protein n=1 Tax=Paralvinella palmiformis TaxID=53620 RepID=A0AAD9IUS0_9ANNE|nr:hypothetical protein LSH36_1120g01062 [Paralvinella palmiformis]
MKRKLQSSGRSEPLNLKRFRSELNQFSKDHSADWLQIQQGGGVREIVKPNKGLNRKQQRKEERRLKKMRKFAFKQKKPLPTKELLELEIKAAAKAEKLKKVKEKLKQRKRVKKRKLKEKQSEAVDVRIQGLIEANKVEDRAIKQLEKQLKLNKRKRKSLPLSFKNDGLDYILNAVDSDHLQAVYDNDDDDLSDPNTPTSSWDIRDEEKVDEEYETGDDSDEEESCHSAIGSSGDDDDDCVTTPPKTSILKTVTKTGKHSKSVDFDLKLRDIKTKKVTMKSSELEVIENSSSDDVGDLSESNSDIRDNKEMETHVKEDIYGRLLPDRGISHTGASKAYVPPGKRHQLSSGGIGADGKKQLELVRLKKQLKGLLNRLSESTIQSISSQIEDFYHQKSRMEMTECLSELVMSSCVSTVLIPERLVMEHAMLVAILHCNIATDIGAYFIQILAQKFDSELQKSDYGATKIVDNVLMLLANLYNFKVVHSLLLFDILKKLTDNFGEKDIELLLLLLKNVGFGLRKDDPSALKELIIKVQQRAANIDTTQFKERSRVKFMIDVLLAIKNNNVRKIPNYDRAHLDHLLKVIRNYVKGGSIAEYQLRISLSDLLESDQRGRWWVIGSAWTRRDVDITKQEPNGRPPEGEVSNHILELARQQRMNTDIRKTIFCIVMTCEDFIDAFEKLLELDLKNQQEREIIHVITDLCLQEKTFNPFYAFLMQKFCEHDRRFQMTTQFTLWDKFKELQEYNDQKLNNLADYLTHLLANKAQSLSVFKVIEFSELDKARVRFIKRVLTNLLLNQPEHIIRDVFIRIATIPKLHLLREGLILFMTHFLLRGTKSLDADVKLTLEQRVLIAEKMLTTGEVKLML